MQGFNSLLPSSTTWQSFRTSFKRMELSLFESAGKLKKGAKDYEEQNFEMKKWCKSNNSFILVQGLRWQGFEGLSLTRQYLENGSGASQFLGIANRNKIFWHFNCLNLDTLTLSGKIRTRQLKTSAEPLLYLLFGKKSKEVRSKKSRIVFWKSHILANIGLKYLNFTLDKSESDITCFASNFFGKVGEITMYS